MSSLWLLKLIHDEDGEFGVDQLGNTEALEMLFELHGQGYIIEEPTTKLWAVTDLGEERLAGVDYEPEELDRLGSPQQHTLVNRMGNLSWRLSHLWEYENDRYAVWMVARARDKSDGFTHACILPDGTIIRPDTTLKGALR